MLRLGAHLIILYIEASHKFYVNCTQVDGIGEIKNSPSPKKIKIGTILKVIPPPNNSGYDKNFER
jgi:hypothetical protein